MLRAVTALARGLGHALRRAGRIVLGSLALAGPLLVAPTVSAAPPSETQLVPPKLTNQVSVEYPAELLEREDPPAGTVIVQYVVATDGSVEELEVLQSVDPLLDQVVVEAVAKLIYEPATFEGEAVEVVLSIGIEIGPPTVEPAPGEGEPGEGEGEPGETGETNSGEPSEGPDADLPLRIRGRLREAGQRTPIENATILAIPAPADWPLGRVRGTRYEEPAEPAWQFETFSDAEGRFELRGLPPGRVRLIVFPRGHERLEYIEETQADGILELEYFHRRLETNPYQTVVSIDREEPDVARRSITPAEINALPGTNGDALKSIQNFPGVARPPFGAGLLVVRGAAPSDTKTYLGYHEIPQLFHFGALTSVFNSDILAQIDFIPGNFDSRFGNAIGGIINVQPRKGRRDGYHGYADADLFDASALVEGPIKKGSFAASVRRSYVDAVLVAVIPKDAGIDFNVAPRYWDYQLLFDYPIKEGNLSARVFGSDDQLAVVAPASNDDEADSNDGFETQIAFHRADLVWEANHGRVSVLLAPSYRHELLSGDGGDIFSFRVTRDSFNFRGELGFAISKRAALRIGTELNTGSYTLEARAPGLPAAGAGDTGGYFAAKLSGPFALMALYGTATIGVTDKFVLYPGVRMSLAGILLKRGAVDPRLRWGYKFLPNTTLKGGVGLYSQIPDIFEYNDVWGNPNIALEKGVHTSAGVEHVFKDYDLTIEGTLFYKYVYSIAVATSALQLQTGPQGTIVLPERFDNSGFGHIGGVELLVRKNLTRNFFGWISYTYLRAFYQIDETEGLRPFDFDQPHILTMIGVYKFPRGWSLGARFRLVSGNPYTPVTDGVLDTSGDFYFPINGQRNSGRLAAFHQLDLRLDKTWTWRYVKLNVYADVQNVYNRRNVEGTQYSYNFQQKKVIAGLPILPTLGLRLDF
jgi:TonB family protein